MRSYRTLSWLVVLCLLALVPLAVAAQEPATVALQTPAAVSAAGEIFTTDVMISNASDLLGFQFDVNFDPAYLGVEKIDPGPFLASTGRSPQPLGPDTTHASTGRVVYGGFTLGSPDQPGASGDGVLATITWKVVQSGDFQASLSRVQLAGAGGRALPGSDTPVPPTPATPQVVEPQPVATEPLAQPDSTLVAVQAAPVAQQQASANLQTVALVAAVAVVLVVAALVLTRRGKSKR